MQLEAFQLKTESISLKLEIINLKTMVNRHLNYLDKITKKLDDAKNLKKRRRKKVKFKRVLED